MTMADRLLNNNSKYENNKVRVSAEITLSIQPRVESSVIGRGSVAERDTVQLESVLCT
jgi:hypothetical protein